MSEFVAILIGALILAVVLIVGYFFVKHQEKVEKEDNEADVKPCSPVANPEGMPYKERCEVAYRGYGSSSMSRGHCMVSYNDIPGTPDEWRNNCICEFFDFMFDKGWLLVGYYGEYDKFMFRRRLANE